MIVSILLIILIILRLVIGVRLILLARQNNLPNIYWLAAQFIFVALGLLFAPVVGNALGGLSISLWMFIIAGSVLPQATLIMFNHTTFYQDRKSPLWWFAAALFVFSIPSLYGVFISKSNYEQSPLLAASTIMTMLVWIWHGWNASQAFVKIDREQAVEDWVKSRYQLIVVYSIALLIGAIGSFIRTFFAGGSAISPLGNAMALLSLVAQIIAVSLQFLVWIMPQGFRNWLNRNQQAHTEERIHKQALAILNIIGSAMSDGTGMTKLIAVYSIRKIIGVELNVEDESKIETHMINMGYNSWLKLIENPELYILLNNSGATISSQVVIMKAKQALIENQSLFTMQAR